MFTIKLITVFLNSSQIRAQVYSCSRYEKYSFSDRAEFHFYSGENTGLIICKKLDPDEGISTIDVYVENSDGKTIDSAHGHVSTIGVLE